MGTNCSKIIYEIWETLRSLRSNNEVKLQFSKTYREVFKIVSWHCLIQFCLRTGLLEWRVDHVNMALHRLSVKYILLVLELMPNNLPLVVVPCFWMTADCSLPSPAQCWGRKAELWLAKQLLGWIYAHCLSAELDRTAMQFCLSLLPQGLLFWTRCLHSGIWQLKNKLK